MMCLSDGYAKSTCASFKVTVSDPMKGKIAKLTVVSKNNDTTKMAHYYARFSITKIQRDGILVL
jgi:hypothetical protein